jgi:hypothetical protein
MTWARALVAMLALALGVVASTALGAGGLRTSSSTETLAAEEVDSVTATCQANRRVISGGFDAEFESGAPLNPDLLVTTSSRLSAREWTTEAANDGLAGDVTTYAYCRDQRLQRVSETVEFPSGSMGSVSVRCPGDKKAISGGYSMTPEDFVGNTPVFRTSESRRVGSKRWRVSTFNNGNDTGDVTVYAHCRRGPEPKVRQRVKDLDDAGGTLITSLKPRCKRKHRVLAGGFASPEPGKGAAAIQTTRKRGARTWQIRARTGQTGAPVTVTAYAYCERKR